MKLQISLIINKSFNMVLLSLFLDNRFCNIPIVPIFLNESNSTMMDKIKL